MTSTLKAHFLPNLTYVHFSVPCTCSYLNISQQRQFNSAQKLTRELKVGYIGAIWELCLFNLLVMLWLEMHSGKCNTISRKMVIEECEDSFIL